MHTRSRVTTPQFRHKSPQRLLLGCRARVLRLPLFVKASNIANPYRMTVLSETMRPNLSLRTPRTDLPVKTYQIMITDRPETASLMPRRNFLYRNFPTRLGRRAMYYNLIYLPHFYLSYLVTHFLIP